MKLRITRQSIVGGEIRRAVDLPHSVSWRDIADTEKSLCETSGLRFIKAEIRYGFPFRPWQDVTDEIVARRVDSTVDRVYMNLEWKEE